MDELRMETEKRMIDANAMREYWLENGENEYVYDTNAVLDSIDEQPTVDAVPVDQIRVDFRELYLKGQEAVLNVSICGKDNEVRIPFSKDVVEVVHGRWLDVQETDMYVPDMKFTITKTAETCSNCKVRIGFIGAKQYLFDAVCPNCGAKMGGGSDG